jgi:hypothetical protein
MRWKKQLKGKLFAHLNRTPELVKKLYDIPEYEEQLHQYFVEDISAIILINMKPMERGLVNGTEVKLYSLWYEDENDRREYEELRAATEVGQTCTLPKPPDAIFVEVSETTALEWDKVNQRLST